MPKPPRTVEEEVARAKSVKPALYSSIERVNASIQNAETFLVSLGLGVTASVDMTAAHDRERDDFTTLAFAKNASEWKFVIVTGNDAYPENAEAVPLLRASKELRLEAAERLPELFSAVIDSAQRQIARAHEAADTIDAFVSRAKEADGGGAASVGAPAAGGTGQVSFEAGGSAAVTSIGASGTGVVTPPRQNISALQNGSRRMVNLSAQPKKDPK